MNSTQRHKALSHCCLMQNLLSTCAQIALACQALCVSYPKRHNTPNQSPCLPEGCIGVQVHPCHGTACRRFFKSTLVPPTLLSSVPADASTKKHPSNWRGASICLSDFCWRLHGLRASVPIRARTTASGSGGNPNLIHDRYVPLHDSAPRCRENQRSLLIVLDCQAIYGQGDTCGAFK